ncbi:MAG: uracil-DNA glycosylase [Myxococcales bacterium]|nr:uracil-DNA glycosylase [Myxococcales bacterium]
MSTPTEPHTPASELASIAAELRRHLAWQESSGQRQILADAASLPRAGTPRAERKAQPPHPASSARPPASRVAPRAAPSDPAPLFSPGQASLGLIPQEPPAEAPRQTLDEVRRELGDCSRCKLGPGRTNLVFGVGNPKAPLVFVGEGPGADEDAQGIPFVGKAGQLLTKMIEAMGFRRDDVYICNVVKCRPPGNRNPEPDEIEACEPFLKAQLRAIRPKAIVALGKFAAQTLLRDPTPITRLRGVWRTYDGTPLMPTFHPAYLLRQPGEKRVAWADLQEVMRFFGLAPKGAKGPGR